MSKARHCGAGLYGQEILEVDGSSWRVDTQASHSQTWKSESALSYTRSRSQGLCEARLVKPSNKFGCSNWRRAIINETGGGSYTPMSASDAVGLAGVHALIQRSGTNRD
jgi:hypothetical protein